MLRKEICELFPERIREIISRAVVEENKLQEIRIRRERPIALRYDGRIIMPRQEIPCVTTDEWKEVLARISRQSMYAFEEEIRQGFLTIPCGHRVGLVGHVVYEAGKIKTMRYLSALNIRISHEVKGCADKILPFIIEEKNVLPTLVIAPPGGGKTTLLRDIIRQIASLCNVTVVDERSEIAGCYMGVAKKELGVFCDVIDGCKKEEGVQMAVRSMAPQVIAVDEIGTSGDVDALQYALTSGCSLLATIHGESLEKVKQKKELRPIFERKMFERFVVLDNLFHPGKCLAVYDKEGNWLWR